MLVLDLKFYKKQNAIRKRMQIVQLKRRVIPDDVKNKKKGSSVPRKIA